MVVARAGTLPCDEALQGIVTFRTGERLKGPRKRVAKKVSFTIEDGFEVVKAKILRLLVGTEFGTSPSVIEEENAFLKPPRIHASKISSCCLILTLWSF